MMACLCHIDLNVAAFQHLLESVAYPEPAWAWLEHVDQWSFKRLDATALIVCEQGRIFTASGELKWRRIRPELWRIVFLGNQLWPGLETLLDASDVLADLESVRKKQVLWGDFHPASGMWIELRIPHKFNYPIEPSPNVCLVTKIWRSKRDGSVHFQRYCELQPMEGNSNAG